MRKFFSEFKAFALKGNVMNLAVGVIIASAFQGVVSSLTENILSPVLGLFTGQNFDALQFEALGITLKYGAFITSVINFLIMALIIFLLMKLVNKLMNIGQRQEEVKEPETFTKKCSYCMTDIHAEAIRCPNCTSQLEIPEAVS